MCVSASSSSTGSVPVLRKIDRTPAPRRVTPAGTVNAPSIVHSPTRTTSFGRAAASAPRKPSGVQTGEAQAAHINANARARTPLRCADRGPVVERGEAYIGGMSDVGGPAGAPV